MAPPEGSLGSKPFRGAMNEVYLPIATMEG